MLTTVVIFVVGCLIAWQARRHMTFAMIALQLFLLVVVSLGALKLESRQDDISDAQTDIVKSQKAIVATQGEVRHEREVRAKVQAEINRYVCNENNKQDRILAGLIEVSVSGTSSFGANIDRSALSPFDLEVLRTIAKVQKLTEGQPDKLKAVFNRALQQLQAETPCGAVVRAFLAASDTDDLKAIRAILREASSGRLHPGEHPRK